MYVKCVECGKRVKAGQAVLEYDDLKETTIPYCFSCHEVKEAKRQRSKGGM